MTDQRRLEPVPLPVKRRRSHSTIAFPYSDLTASERLAGHVLDGGGECRPEQLSVWLGHSTLNSGAYRNKVVAAGLFGLVESTRNRISLTPLGERIHQDRYKRQARVEAFLTVSLYLALFETYRSTRLPGMILLEQEMIARGVTRTQVRFARQVLMRSAEQAGFFESSDQKLILPKGAHLPTGGEDAGVPAIEKNPDPQPVLPRLITAILEEAPWNEGWTKAEFEEWAELLVRAARVHFGIRSE